MAKIVTIPVLNSDMTPEQVEQEGLYYEYIGDIQAEESSIKSYMAVIYSNIYLFGYNNPSAGVRTLRFLVGFKSPQILDLVVRFYVVTHRDGDSISSIISTEIPRMLQIGNDFFYYIDITPSPDRPIGFAIITEGYNNLSDVVSDISYIGTAMKYPITYRPTNCSFPGAPIEAAVGDTVVVPVTFPDGYGLINESNIYVTNNGVVIPSTYSNGQLTFTMPDPS